MAKQKSGEIIVGLDIGTTKICAIVGELTDSGIDIIGIGTHPSKGLRKGVVVNIEATVSSIRRAVEEAELMAGAEISHVYTGIAGGHIKGFNSQGIVAVKDKEVREADIARVIDAAKAVAMATGATSSVPSTADGWNVSLVIACEPSGFSTGVPSSFHAHR